MTRAWRCICAALVILVLAACGSATPADSTLGRLSSPRPAPPLSGPGLAGNHHDVNDLRGSVVVVSAWASWCAPCREEVPVLARAQERLGPHGLVVLGLNVRDHPDAARAFVEEEGVGFPSVVDQDGTIAVGWGLRGMPETFLVDRTGSVVAHSFGAITDEWVDSVVAPAVDR